MAQVIATNPNLHRVGTEWVELGLEDVPDQTSGIIQTTISTKQDFERFEGMNEFDYPGVFSEGQTVTTQSLEQTMSVQVRPKLRAICYEVSVSAQASDFYDKIANPARLMGRTHKEYSNLTAAYGLQSGWTAPGSGGTITLDNLALWSSAHTKSTGTYANIPSAHLALSMGNLESMEQLLRQQVGHKGKPIIVDGPSILAVNSSLKNLAFILCQSQGRAQVADNDINVLRGVLEPVVYDYLPIDTAVNQSAYYLINKRRNPIARLQRIPLTIAELEFQRNLMKPFLSYEEFVVFARDARGLVGTRSGL